MTVAWNPAQTSSGVTITSGTGLDFPAVSPPSGFNYSAVTDSGPATSKFYLEFQVGANGMPGHFGLCDPATWVIDTANGGINLGGTAVHYIGLSTSANVYNNNSTIGTTSITGFVPGDIFQISGDSVAGKIWFGKNNTFEGNPAAGTGGFSFSNVAGLSVCADQAGGLARGGILRTTAASQSFSPPSGFSAFEAAGGSLPTEFPLLEDGVSKVLLEDGVSKLGFEGTIAAVTGSPITGYPLLEGGTSRFLLEDGTTLLTFEGGPGSGSPVYIYIGPSAWSTRYKGVKSDAALYKGAKTLHP